MLVLSDCPERLAGLARVEDGSEVGVDSLPPGDRALWRALGTGRAAVARDGAGPWPARVLVARR